MERSKYYLFTIFFTFSNVGFLPGAPQISSPKVSVTAFNNVSLKCLVGVRPRDCYDSKLQWRFSNRWMSLKSGEKYEIQERKTKTKCRTDFMITIFNVTYADEGMYSCDWFCNKDDPWRVFRSSTIQLKVVSGMNNCVIVSSAFSKGVIVGEIFVTKKRGEKTRQFPRGWGWLFEVFFQRLCARLVSYRFPLKTVHTFQNFLAVLPPPHTIQS